MKLQRTPLILLLVALALGTGVFIYESQVSPKQEETQAKSEKLFPFEEKDVQSLSVTTLTQSLSFQKTPAQEIASSKKPPKPQAEKSPKPSPSDSKVWMMVAPQKTYADPASVAFLLNLMATGQRQQTITAPATQRSEFGFDQPFATIEVKLNNQQTHRLLLGKQNFDQSAIYAQVDPPTNPTQDLSIILVSSDFENAVNRPLSEWQIKQKPTK